MTTKTIPLRFPVEVGGKTLTEVAFRRPKARDMALIARMGEIEGRAKESGVKPSPAEEAEAMMLIVRAVTGLSEEVVGEIDLMEDIPVLAEEAARFLESIAAPAQPNGGK